MKAIIMLVLVMCPFLTYAQRLNEHGLKMVSEVEIFDWELDKILFEYNEQNRLISMTIYKDWNWSKAKYDPETYNSQYKLYAKYSIKNGKMIFKRYDEEYRNPLYDFKFDEWGHIVSFKEKYLAEWLKGEVVEHEYGYSYDERMKRYVLSNDSFMNKSYLEIRKGVNIAPDHRNDTNISTEWIFYFANCEYSVDYYFLISEWVDCINDYFHKNFWKNQFQYTYDSRGNLIEIRENNDCPSRLIEVKDGKKIFYDYKWLETLIRFKYLE